MAVPLKYNWRNLQVRWRSTITTILGVALVVAVFVLVMSLHRGMRATYINTGDPRNLLVLRKGSTAESSSQIPRDQARLIRYAPGIARTQDDQPLASAEVIVLALLQRREGGQANVQVRGLGPVGLELRPQVRLVEGRMFVPGRRECIVSRRIAERFEGCRVGETFRAGATTWRVVGMFEAQRTAHESEIWMDADECRSVFQRDFFGSVLLRPVDASVGAALAKRLESDPRLSVKVVPETLYYQEQTRSAGLFQFLASFLAVIMSVGAAFAAMNTMYAAVGARTRELGTLRVLGFRRRDIYLAIMAESILLGLLGGVIGCALALPMNGLATGTMSQSNFAELTFEFRITGELLAKGMGFAVVMGVLGGLLPARVAARKPVLDALRSV